MTPHSFRAPRSRARRLWPLALVLAMAPCGGCAALGEALRGVEQPSASIAGVRLDGLTLEGARLVFAVDVHNPYGVGLPLSSLAYRVESEGRALVSGALEVDGSVPARGSRTLDVPVELRFADLLAALSDVRPGALIPYRAALDLSVDTPATGRLALPLATEGELPIPALPEVSLAGVEWQELSPLSARAELLVGVTNANAFPVDLEDLSFSLALGGKRVVESHVAQAASFQAQGAQTLRVPVSFSTLALGSAAFGLLKAATSDYAIEGSLRLRTPFGVLALPVSRKGSVQLTR